MYSGFAMKHTGSIRQEKVKGYRQIAAELQGRIEDGAFQAGHYLPTERQLQQEFGASRTTVRKALAYLVESGFGRSIPNRGVVAARGTRPGTSMNIALIDGGTYVMRVLTLRVAEMLREQGYYLVHLGGSIDYPLEYALQQALDHDFAGALVWSYRGFPDLEFLSRASRRLPIVALDHRLEGTEADLVTFDQELAAEQATEQLIANGCRRIAVTGMLDMLEVTHHRFRGYLRAMFKHGLNPQSRDFVFSVTSGMDQPDVWPLEQRLRASDAPDGLLVLQDLYMPPTVEAALRAGRRLGDDLKVVAIGDDLDLDVDGLGMTAISFDWDALAREALRLLFDRIGDPSRPLETVTVPHHLVVRGLCGASGDARTTLPEGSGGFSVEPTLPRSQFRYSSQTAVVSDGPITHR